MALGDMAIQNNNDKGKYNPTVYSPYRLSNPESTVDPTALGAKYWNGMLTLTISPRKNTTDGSIAYDSDNAVSIYLTHTKARILHDELLKFVEDPNQFNNVGVPSGTGLISICNGKEFGITTPCLVIKKLNAENGSVESSFAYEFKQDFHYSIRNFDESKSEFDKIYYNTLEIEQLATLLKTYYEAMSGAVAYTVVDNMKYDVSRMTTKITAIGEKLGVEFGGGNGYKNNKSSSSIFNNKEPRNFSSGTLADIENQMK